MRMRRTARPGFILAVIASLTFTGLSTVAAVPPAIAPVHAEAPFRPLPLRFEANEGQTGGDVRFLGRGRDGLAFLTGREVVLRLEARGRGASAVVRLAPVGASPTSRVTGLDRLPGTTNYFFGDDPSRWRTNVPGFAKVRYEGVYPGVDLVYYGNERGSLEYDFVVAPGADPSKIAMTVDGAEGIRIDEVSGDLLMKTTAGELRQHAPRIYQETDGVRRAVAGSYVMRGEREIGFELASYDAALALVIDPEVVYSTLLGSSAGDQGYGIAVDAAGCAYVTGRAGQIDFPLEHPYQSTYGGVFITKLSADGSSLVYSTFLGATTSHAIKVDATGAVYVVGNAGAGFPLKNPIQSTLKGNSDAFITKLSPDGASLVYSTYLGGSSSPNQPGDDEATDIGFTSENVAIVVGTTQADLNDFPLVNPVQAAYGGGTSDWFVSVIDPNGSALLASSYFGGNDQESPPTVAVDGSDAFVLNGSSYSSDLVSTGSSRLARQAQGRAIIRFGPVSLPTMGLVTLAKAIVIELNPISTDVSDIVEILTVEDIEEAYTFQYNSQFGPFESRGGRTDLDAIVALRNTDLHLVRNVGFGGSGSDYGRALATDPRGIVYVAGFTDSMDLPTRGPTQAAYGGGSSDAFVAAFAPESLGVVFATYLGGDGLERIGGMALDPQGNIYVMGHTESADFATTSGAFQSGLLGQSDVFITKYSALGPLEPDFAIATDPSTITATKGQKGTITVDVSRLVGFDGRVTVMAPDTKAIKVKLSPRSQSTTGDSVTFAYKVKKKAAAGTYPVVFTARDEAGRDRTATLTLEIR